MTKYSLSAMMAAGLLAGGLSIGSANAADLGGDCCADLEERVAELEATTARKGNRKVSLTISGWVAQQLLYWDDGEESNVYITDTGSISIGSHIAFTGSAQIVPGWTAGYRINIEVMDNDSLTVNQFVDDGGNAFAGASTVGVENSYWFIKGDRYGTVSLGLQSGAADNQAILVDGSGSLIQANYVLYDVNGFLLRRNDGALTAINYGSLAACQTFGNGVGAAADCEGDPNNNIKYTTPTFAGFSMSASWGEDDVWGISGRYAGEVRDLKFAAAVAYTHRTDEASGALAQAIANGGLDASAWQIGAYVQHVPTGLFLYGAYSSEDSDTTQAARGAGQLGPEGDNWYIKTGLRRQFNPLGHTVLYFEYGQNNDKINPALFDAGVSNTELEQYGIGVVQEIDAAAMSLWLAWRHYEADDIVCADQAAGSCAAVGLNNGTTQLEDFDIIKAGALINF